MISRFFCPFPLPASGEIQLPEALAHHAVRVLRLRDGDPLILFDGGGGEVPAVLHLRGKQCFATLAERRGVERESPLPLVLVQALASGDKMDWIVQKAVELGVSALVPVQAERSVLRLAGERAAKRVEHWQQVAVSGQFLIDSEASLSGLTERMGAGLIPGDAKAQASAGPIHEGTGTVEELIQQLEGEMKAAAKQLEFERAAALRDRIRWLRLKGLEVEAGS